MHVFGLILVIGGILVGLAGELTILRSAYRQSVMTLFACLMLPFGEWLYALLDMRRPGLALALSVGGTALVFAGCHFCGVPLWEF